MARKGENIYKRKDGRWEARYIKTYSIDGKAKYGYCYAHSYQEVKEKVSLAKIALLASPNSIVIGNKKRLADYCDEWLRHNKFKVKETTYAKYYAMIQNHIKPKIGNYVITTLNSLIVENFARELLIEKELAPKTVKDILVLLNSIITYTRKNHLGSLPFIDIVYPKETKKETRVLTRVEQQKFTEFLLSDMDNIKFGILLTLITGLRIGEICALRWSDILLDEKIIKVSSTMQRIKNMDSDKTAKTKIIISDPKSDSSVRLIPLTEYTVKLCDKFNNQIPNAFVLSGSPYHYIEPRVLQYKLKRFTKECGLKDVHYHTLRHSFATRCVEVGFEIKSLSEILGHSSPRITLERYVHTSMELKRNNMNKLALIGY